MEQNHLRQMFRSSFAMSVNEDSRTHNYENVMAASAMAYAYGVPSGDPQKSSITSRSGTSN